MDFVTFLQNILESIKHTCKTSVKADKEDKEDWGGIFEFANE